MSKILDKQLRWEAELIFKPEDLTMKSYKLYFNNENYFDLKYLLDITDGNKTEIYSKKLNHHTAVMIKEALLDEDFVGCLEQTNKALYDWDIKLKVLVDGKEVPFYLLNYDTKESITTDILENGKIYGINHDKFKVFEHREGLYVNNDFRMDLQENEDNSYSYIIYNEYEEYKGICDNPEDKPFYQIAADIIEDFKDQVLPALDDLLREQHAKPITTPVKVKFEELEF